MAKAKDSLNNVESLEYLLKDILTQIKVISQDEKDTPYTKLIELFFKGIDLREKIVGSENKNDNPPQNNFIKGIDGELL